MNPKAKFEISLDKVSNKVDAIRDDVIDHEARIKVLEKEDERND